VIREELGTDPDLVAAIVDPHLPYGGAEEVRFYRNLLSGVLDPDKLDYLNRDAYFCGVPYGVQDVDFVFAEIRAHPQGLAVTEKGLTAVESVLFSKYLMYRSVYWHKTVRIATAMIKKAVLLGLEQGVLSPSELYWLDDQEFYTRTREHGFPPFQLIPRVVPRRLYKQIESRVAAEAARLSGAAVPPHAVIIDIPEPIRFEIDVPVLLQEEGRTASYQDSGSVFTPQIVSGFGGALRRISLIADVDPGLQGALARIGPARILEGGL
jgi:hypothetical protein